MNIYSSLYEQARQVLEQTASMKAELQEAISELPESAAYEGRLTGLSVQMLAQAEEEITEFQRVMGKLIPDDE